MTNETVIEELNTLLRGTYMGIRSLEHYIQKINNLDLKKNFQHIQQEQKQNAQKIAEEVIHDSRRHVEHLRHLLH